MSRPEPLTSAANATVRRLIRMRDNRSRRRARCVIVDGWRETQRAVDGGLELVCLYTVEGPSPPEFSGLVKLANERNSHQFVSATIMEKIGYGESSRGVVAEFAEPDRELSQIQLSDTPLVLVLDQIEKPGNVGAVFRCADAIGIEAVILCDCATDLFNPNAIRSSLGTVFTVAAASAVQADVREFLIERNIRPLAARVESSAELWVSDLTGPLAIVLGSEANGLGPRWQSLGDQPIEGVRIPMAGRVDSLNISVSAAVIAFEAARVRNANA